MRKILSLITITAVLFASCTKSTNTPTNNNGNSSNSTVITGDFVITKFTDASSSDDKSSNFSGYMFTFKSDGTVSAVKNGIAENGNYTQKPAHEGEAAKLELDFSSESLEELNKKWQIDLISENSIHLRDDGNSSEVLQFTAE